MSASKSSSVGAEIRQGRPFKSEGQEATIALLRTASVVRRALARVIEPYDLSLAQYNALRIIRGAGSHGIPTLMVRARLIEEGTTVTRLVDKLQKAGLIRRERAASDRRQVICRVTDKGVRLLDALDPLVDRADAEAMATLDDRELTQFIRRLDAVRAANADRATPRSMAGS